MDENEWGIPAKDQETSTADSASAERAAEHSDAHDGATSENPWSETARDERADDPDDETEEGDEDASDESSPSAGKRTKRTSARTGGALTLGQARRALRTVETLRTAPDKAIGLAVALSGTRVGVEDSPRERLATQILTGRAQAGTALRDVREIAEADAMEAGVVAGLMGRQRLRPVWDLLHLAGCDIPAEPPAADSKLAITVAREAHSLTEDTTELIEDAVRILEG
ncbi:hypothetical protein Bequi_09790 [Brachybacterium sp. JHP9]|uniref:DUF222 domain-containing protein n=1 Tax=Brachybacterium equifaecis TaxID=2910770 RepID=A0ABT0R172_9MICO|nr:hypothetical protein [Brachybacterium equifaecis]MCL6423674.1 hypothetical protein [Brachybacterium equifaecis]